MKKTLPLLCIIVGLVLAVSACVAIAPSQPAAPTPGQAEVEAPAQEAAGEPVHLVIWWWGEQEAPGAQTWLDETMAAYQQEHPNVTFEAVLQSTDSLIPAFQSAAAAQEGPDIQYFWGGVWTLEPAWNGALVPVDDLIPTDEMAHYINNFERSYDGKTWGVPWYLSGNPIV